MKMYKITKLFIFKKEEQNEKNKNEKGGGEIIMEVKITQLTEYYKRWKKELAEFESIDN